MRLRQISEGWFDRWRKPSTPPAAPAATATADRYADDDDRDYDRRQQELLAQQQAQQQARRAELTARKRAKARSRPGYHVHPDMLYGNAEDAAPFLYTNAGELHVGKARQNHRQMIQGDAGLAAAYPIDGSTESWSRMSSDCLLGRIGNMDGSDPEDQTRDTVSYWESPNTARLLLPSVRALLARGLIGPDTQVHHPQLQDTTVAGLLAGAAGERHDPAVSRRAELARRLHLLPSDQKRATMRELGLAAHGKPNRWRDRMRQHGIPAGSSHHFGTSEGLVRPGPGA